MVFSYLIAIVNQAKSGVLPVGQSVIVPTGGDYTFGFSGNIFIELYGTSGDGGEWKSDPGSGAGGGGGEYASCGTAVTLGQTLSVQDSGGFTEMSIGLKSMSCGIGETGTFDGLGGVGGTGGSSTGVTSFDRFDGGAGGDGNEGGKGGGGGATGGSGGAGGNGQPASGSRAGGTASGNGVAGGRGARLPTEEPLTGGGGGGGAINGGDGRFDPAPGAPGFARVTRLS